MPPIPFKLAVEGHHHIVGERWPAANGYDSVILLHGGGQTRHSWKNTASTLADRGWTATAYDARGHGDSDWRRDGDYSLEGFARDLEHVVADIPRTPVLVGASLGGMTSLTFGGGNPGRVRALVLVDIAPKIDDGESHRIQDFMKSNFNGFASLEEAAEAVHAYNPLRARPSSLGGLRRSMRLREDGRWYWRWDPALLSLGSEPLRDVRPSRLLTAAAQLRVPVLVVRGKQSQMVSDQAVEELRSVIPDVRSIDISGAGHMVAGDDNDAFSEAILDFLDEIRSRA